MKYTVLIALLGAAFTLALPSITHADNSYQNKRLDQSQHKNHLKKDRRYKKNKQYKAKKFVNKSAKKRHFVKNKHASNKHAHNKRWHSHRHHAKHNHREFNYYESEPYFSITWDNGGSTISYGNNAYNNGYSTNRPIKNRGKRIYQRLNNQARRIQRGINNGQLVKREVRKLRSEQRDIRQTLNHYKRDGYLNRYERSKLNNLLDIASNRIYRKSHNHLTRYTRHHRQYAQY